MEEATGISYCRFSKIVPDFLKRFIYLNVMLTQLTTIDACIFCTCTCCDWQLYCLFILQQIDGEAFLLLTQSDIVKILSIKLGPALKIYNSIIMLKSVDEE